MDRSREQKGRHQPAPSNDTRAALARSGLPLVVLAGPTAAGKTALAVELAERIGGAILGADSVQVYRGFDIGSGKPTASELRGIEHHLLDILNPPESIDAAQFARRADDVIHTLHRRGLFPIVTAGTGLWLRALLRGLVPLPPANPSLRQQLLRDHQRYGDQALHARLLQVDPELGRKLHPRDSVRVLRALEVFAQVGRPLSSLQKQHRQGQRRYRFCLWVVEDPMQVVTDRIETRIDTMFARGWTAETRDLLDKWGPAPKAFRSVGYRQLVAHVVDGVSATETRRTVRKSMRDYARRQRNWFRSEPDVDARLTQRDAYGQLAALEAWALDQRNRR